jgi:threonine synthase
MHPRGRVSRTQERQMTTVMDDNVFNLAVEGTFDDCQRIMKSLFSDLPFKDRYRLGSVNSINWARLMAQIVYYFYGAFRVQERTGCRRVRFAVPTGNFGDIFAGYLAARMGLPISVLVLATNENNILARCLQTGQYRLGRVVPTVSPSMDIQVASNFERYLYYRLGRDATALRELLDRFAAEGAVSLPLPRSIESADDLFRAGDSDTASTLRTIREVYEQHGYLLDPHTAVGVHVALRHMDEREPMICLATAHPAKFDRAVRDAVGKDVAHHPILDALEDLPARCDELPADVGDVRDYIERKVGGST